MRGDSDNSLLCAAERGEPPSVAANVLRRPPEARQTPETFAFYRILGNDLVPRHKRGQHRDNLAFILRHEPNLPDCTRYWILNRIVDPNQESDLIDLLEDAGEQYIRIPFRWDEYAQIGWDDSWLPEPEYFQSRAFHRLSPEQAATARLRLYRHKNNYVMNNNGARNVALRHGRERGHWILPWDGNCFVNEAAWNDLRTGIEAYPGARYVIVPMQRLTDNQQALTINGPEQATEEPQIVFRHDAREYFDEAQPYGRWPKTELLCRLGVPGRWEYFLHKPWDLPVPDYSPEAGHFIQAGWVMRLASGRPNAEAAHDRAIWLRADHRAQAFQRFLAELDAKIPHKEHSGQ